MSKKLRSRRFTCAVDPSQMSNEIRDVTSNVAHMNDPTAQVRALDTLAGQHVSDPESLEELAQLFLVARSLGVQAAIAGILIRSDYQAIATLNLAQELRESSLAAAGPLGPGRHTSSPPAGRVAFPCGLNDLCLGLASAAAIRAWLGSRRRCGSGPGPARLGPGGDAMAARADGHCGILAAFWIQSVGGSCRLSQGLRCSPSCCSPWALMMRAPTRRRCARSRSIRPTRRKHFAGACPRTIFSLSSWWSAGGPIGWNRPAARVFAATCFSSQVISMTAPSFIRIGSDARESLATDELERASCSDSCPGLFSQLKEVYLFGCNTLNAKLLSVPSGEIARSLVRSGYSPVDADRRRACWGSDTAKATVIACATFSGTCR